jgi:hypothetical protein
MIDHTQKNITELGCGIQAATNESNGGEIQRIEMDNTFRTTSGGILPGGTAEACQTLIIFYAFQQQV